MQVILQEDDGGVIKIKCGLHQRGEYGIGKTCDICIEEDKQFLGRVIIMYFLFKDNNNMSEVII